MEDKNLENKFGNSINSFKIFISGTARSSWEYSGQKCSACSRLYIPQSMWPKFLEEISKIHSQIKLGDVSFSRFCYFKRMNSLSGILYFSKIAFMNSLKLSWIILKLHRILGLIRWKKFLFQVRDPSIFLSAVIDERAFDRISGYIGEFVLVKIKIRIFQITPSLEKTTRKSFSAVATINLLDISFSPLWSRSTIRTANCLPRLSGNFQK